jgi:hypothetical protein
MFPNQVGPRARVRQAEANALAALDAFDGTVLQALKEVEQALSIYRSEIERREALADMQEKGAVPSIWIEADAAAAISETALGQDQIAIFKALGGGW